MVDANLWGSIPFVLLLASVAVGPFIRTPWWERSHPYVAPLLGAGVIAAEFALFRTPERVWHAAVEYVSFISLIASLFVVTGGIVVHIGGTATPLKNSLVLLAGAVLANLMGTTGAAMLLIRPFLRLNRERLKPYLVVFFIFLVANVGGCLTPVGDPPLFLGYLRGVPFLWPLAAIWHAWAFAMALLLAVFFILDARAGAGKGGRPTSKPRAERGLALLGGHNLAFLGAILGAVFLPTPWREVVMLAAATASYLTTPRAIREEHDFDFRPIQEVAVLFAGIFATMVPALTWLEGHARHLGLSTPGSFYWATGSLSSVLDNAPTYLSFLTAALGCKGVTVSGLLATSPQLVKAISVGAVFFGACTYIGNGPNFMVKCIADQAGANCPSFVGYVYRYTFPVLLPTFTLVWVLFFR